MIAVAYHFKLFSDFNQPLRETLRPMEGRKMF